LVKTAPPLGRREQLLDAATVCFAEQGYNAAKVSDVVARAGVAQGTFYLYFKSKREVLLALFERFCQALLDACGSDDDLPTTLEAYRERMLARARQVLRVTLEQRPLAAVFFKEALGADPDLERQLRAFHDAMAELTKRRLRRAMELGLIRPVDAEVAAYAISGMWERVVAHCLLMSPHPTDPDQLAEQVVSLQLDGLARRPSQGGSTST